MARSPRSRGKGSRRGPWREGGAGKRKPAGAWQHRAQHMVGSVDELQQPVAAIDYSGVYGEKAGHNIYLFDQEMAKLGVAYFAEYRQGIAGTTRFTIYVPKEQAGAVASIAARLHKI